MARGRTNTKAIFHNVPPPVAIIDLQKLGTLLVFHCTENCDPSSIALTKGFIVIDLIIGTGLKLFFNACYQL